MNFLLTVYDCIFFPFGIPRMCLQWVIRLYEDFYGVGTRCLDDHDAWEDESCHDDDYDHKDACDVGFDDTCSMASAPDGMCHDEEVSYGGGAGTSGNAENGTVVYNTVKTAANFMLGELDTYQTYLKKVENLRHENERAKDEYRSRRKMERIKNVMGIKSYAERAIRKRLMA